MSNPEKESELKWWIRFVVVPLLGGGGVIALIIAFMQRPDESQNDQVKPMVTDVVWSESSTDIMQKSAERNDLSVGSEAVTTREGVWAKEYLYDGRIGTHGGMEWASRGNQNPYVEINLDKPYLIEKILLWDRANLIDQVMGGKIEIDQHDVMTFGGLDNSGKVPLEVNIESVVCNNIRIKITGIGSSHNVGFSEVRIIGKALHSGMVEKCE